MRKIWVFITLLSFIYLTASSEIITKDDVVYKTTRYQGSMWLPGPKPIVTNYVITFSTKYDEGMNQIGLPVFGLFAHDDNYDYADEFSLFFMGTAYEFDNFVSEMLNFLQNGENGMGKTIGETHSVNIVNGKLLLSTHNESAYHQFKLKELKNIQKKFREYCKKNNIELTD